jgi:cytochrome c
MRSHLAIGMLVATCCLFAAVAHGQSRKTVWTGAFSAAQAVRGETVFKQKCSTCHRDDLKGNIDGGPPLIGPDFQSRWDGMTLADMVSEISELMPASEPNSLPKQDYVDILAFVFRANGATMGADDLQAVPELLQEIPATKKP